MNGNRPQPHHDVFICHASEDKDGFVRPLAHALRERHIDVWYDEFVLNIGDSLRVMIDRGLATSRFGIVVVSPSFFAKAWPQRELNGLVARETFEGRPVVLPIWHHVGRDEVLRFSPPLADAVAISSAEGIEEVVQRLVKVLRPDPSPLLVAREFLLSKGLEAPSVTDEFWLDLVGIKNSQLDQPSSEFSRWMFPLPFPREQSTMERGLNIGWTSLQLDWICQLTPPDEVHAFLQRSPGLFETARKCPGILAMYVPQVTIRGYDSGFEDVFDDLLDPSRKDAYQMPGYSDPRTIDGRRPLCGELIAWRHPTFGNYADRELGASFVNAHTDAYSRSLYDERECLVWLLCDASNWMPEELKVRLIRGVTNYYCRVGHLFAGGSALGKALRGPPSKFRFTRNVRTDIRALVVEAIDKLDIDEDPDVITERFVKSDIVASVYAERRELEEMRRKRAP